jgi:signal transduction histidine kinase
VVVETVPVRLSTRARVALVAVGATVMAPWLVAAGPRGSSVVVECVAFVLGAVQVGSLWWADRWPGPVTAIVTAAAAGLLLFRPAVGVGVAPVALCVLAWLRPPRVSVWGLVAMSLLAPLGWVSGSRVDVAIVVVGVVLAWSWGELGRVRQARRLAEARAAAGAERVRIARELHDVLAHTVSVMVVQASAAEDAFESDPRGAREAVQAVERAGRQAMVELRQLLHTIRVNPDETSTGPQPTLADLGALAAAVRAAGLEVRLRLEGVEYGVPAAIGLAVYRIVQESLTNTLRHAGARSAEVVVCRVGACLTAVVIDDGDGPTAQSVRVGQGIAGMRQRAAEVGGTVRTGRGPNGGFRVCAELPCGGPK